MEFRLNSIWKTREGLVTGTESHPALALSFAGISMTASVSPGNWNVCWIAEIKNEASYVK